MYIDRKGWEIPAISVKANLFQNNKEEKLNTIIDRDIKILGPVTDEQRDTLTDIAKSCPISKILQGEIQLRTFTFNESEIEKQIKYPNGDITVVWKPEVCRHSGRCVTQLPGVFNLQVHPWINMAGATTEEIITQVNKYPTGALSITEKL